MVGMVKNYYPELFHNTVLHNEYKVVQKNIIELSDFLCKRFEMLLIWEPLKWQRDLPRFLQWFARDRT